MKAKTLKVGELYLIKNSRHGWKLLSIDPGGSAHKVVSSRQEATEGYEAIPKGCSVTQYVTSAEIVSPFDEDVRTELRARYKEAAKNERKSRTNTAWAKRQEASVIAGRVGQAIINGSTLASQKEEIGRARTLLAEAESPENNWRRAEELRGEIYDALYGHMRDGRAW